MGGKIYLSCANISCLTCGEDMDGQDILCKFPDTTDKTCTRNLLYKSTCSRNHCRASPQEEEEEEEEQQQQQQQQFLIQQA